MLHIVAIVLVAAFGALARALSNSKRKLKVRIAVIVMEGVVAMFGGLIVYFISEYLQMDTNLAFILAGVSGYTSPQLIDVVSSVTIKKVEAGVDMGTEVRHGKD